MLAHDATLVLYEPPACDPQSSCQEAKLPKPIPAPQFIQVTFPITKGTRTKTQTNSSTSLLAGKEQAGSSKSPQVQ